MKKAMLIKNALLIVATTVALVGCNDSSEICRDFVAAVAEKAVECGYPGTVEEAAAEFEATFESPGEGCDGIAGIRDETELYEVCIPSIESSGCGAALHPACDRQLIYIRR